MEFDIWFCKYDEISENDYNFGYIKLMYKNLKEVLLNDYIRYLCHNLGYKYYKIIDKYHVKLDKDYMLFICESEEN